MWSFNWAKEQASLHMMTQETFIDDCPFVSDNESCSDFDDKSCQFTIQEPPGLESQNVKPEVVSPFTTVMLRNVPCKINKASVEVELAKLSFANTYDYIYFPTRRNKSTIGYGFINFIKSDDALAFMDVFDGYIFPGTSSTKRCYVSRADVQGREANLAQCSSQNREVVASPVK